jgi:hypothetical protein
LPHNLERKPVSAVSTRNRHDSFSNIPMDEHAEMLRLATGTGIIHHLVIVECPVQRREAEGKQCEI